MWWHDSWGPMYGWWFMPVFGLVLMVVFLFILARLFGAGGMGRGDADETARQIEALRREVAELRAAIDALRRQEPLPGEEDGDGGRRSGRRGARHDHGGRG